MILDHSTLGVRKISRRGALQSLVGACTAVVGARGVCAEPPREFRFADVQQLARELAQRPHEAPPPLPNELRQLNYDQHRLIAFRHERALWRDERLPFWVEFHHRGFLSADRVDVHLVEDGRERRFPFDPRLFQYRGELASLTTSNDWGFAGFRLLCRLPSRPNFQEFCSFLGASYFRGICTNQVYGISARGLAIDAGLPRPEEFPRFRTFWIERPAADARSVRVWALLDSASATGAYEFTITPGLNQTTLDIDARLHFRRAVDKLCLAPMSSMWLHDQGASDSRPEVHDSDGLLIAQANGEWLWRPLARRERASVSQFQSARLAGFGLMQRDRDWQHYRDDEAKYHLRPSVWITPRDAWEGTVELLELPTDTETADNIAAYFVPRQRVRAGDTLSLRYQVAFAAGDPDEHRGGRFVNTQVERLAREAMQFDLDIDSTTLRSLASNVELQALVTADRGNVRDASCRKLPGGAWRVRFVLERDGDRPTELRAYLRRNGDVLSETWSYLCT